MHLDDVLMLRQTQYSRLIAGFALAFPFEVLDNPQFDAALLTDEAARRFIERLTVNRVALRDDAVDPIALAGDDGGQLAYWLTFAADSTAAELIDELRSNHTALVVLRRVTAELRDGALPLRAL